MTDIPTEPTENDLKIIAVDLDGTLLPDTTAFEVILRGAGRGDEVAASDARYFAGGQSLEETFWEQWEWIRAMSPQELHRHLRRSDAWLAGIGEAVSAWRERGWRVWLLTDQPSTVAEYVMRWGFEQAVCSQVTVLEGEQLQIEAKFDKWANLRQHLEATSVAPEHVVHIGNGSNDVPVWAHTRGIAVFAEADVAQHADHDAGRIASLADLTPILERHDVG